jgi:transcriptional regulator GlxA family with amidase domain
VATSAAAHRNRGSPHQWLVWQRVDLARRLLETTSLSVEGVASAAGFGSAQTVRLHFRDRLGTSPSDYRSAYAPGREGCSARGRRRAIAP